MQEQYYYPRGSIYTTSMELGPKDHPYYGFRGPTSVMVVYMDPLGIAVCATQALELAFLCKLNAKPIGQITRRPKTATTQDEHTEPP